MKISIITPSFNQGQYIEEAILSVLTQQYHNFEHIIIDAGSTDETIDVLNKYPHLIWISEPDEGQSDALNKGFKLATGDVIGWLNSDEYYLPNAFNTVCSEFSKEKDFEVLYGSYIYKDGINETLKFSIPYVPNMIFFRQYINTVSFFFSKKVILNGNFIDKNYHAAMDKDFVVRLEKLNYKFKLSNQVFGVFRFHENCKSNFIRQVQIDEGREIILKYLFNNSKLFFNLFFWPIKYSFDILYKILFALQKIKYL